MLICVQTRAGTIHIVNYESHYAHGDMYYTICGEKYNTKNNKQISQDILTIFSASDTIRGSCRICHDIYAMMVEDDLNYNPRIARGGLLEDLIAKYQFNKELKVKLNLEDFSNKVYPKLSRIRTKKYLSRK